MREPDAAGVEAVKALWESARQRAEKSVSKDILELVLEEIIDSFTDEVAVSLDEGDASGSVDVQKMHMGIGIGTGEHRATEAANAALEDALLENCKNKIVKVINVVVAPSDIGPDELENAASLVQESFPTEAGVLFSCAIDDSLGDGLCVSVLAFE